MEVCRRCSLYLCIGENAEVGIDYVLYVILERVMGQRGVPFANGLHPPVME